MSILSLPATNSPNHSEPSSSGSQTPVSPVLSNASAAASAPASAPAAPAKRSSRRANTAERRATHNAVERARRETLNGRFLDLAAMLPNLAAVRRPSKSAIVNSSIALIHAQRRHRAVAGRELRNIKAEADALRQELNEWRIRANIPRVEEPSRSSDLIALLSLEEEADMGEDERRAYEMRDAASYEDGEDLPEDGEDGYGPESQTQYAVYAHPSQPIPIQPPQPHHQAHLAAQHQQHQQQQQHAAAAAAAYAQQQQHHAAMARANQLHMAPAHPRPSVVVAQPMPQVQIPQPPLAFDATVYGLEHKVDSYYTPTSAHPSNHPAQWSHGPAHPVKPSPYASTANQAFLAYPQATNLGMFQSGFMAAAREDDASSIGSSHGQESTQFGGASPDHSLGNSPVDSQFAYSVSGYVHHHQQQQPPQARRPSINIPGQAFAGAKQPSPTYQANGGAPFAAMGLMM